MLLTTTKISPRSLLPLLSTVAHRSFSGAATPSAESRSAKLNRIADELCDLSNLECRDISILFRRKLGVDWVAAASVAPAVGGAASSSGEVVEEVKEKTAFDVKLEKFDAGAKIKVIKEVRAFTDLGLKEAKEMVEKAPVVVKQGVAKEEAEAIVAKLKAAGATVVLE